MSWLNNAWVVGVSTGIVSGLLVTWLLNLFLSKKKDREYEQRIAAANREVILSVRAGIPDDNLPGKEVVEALIHSTARRYSVQPTELYQPKELSEELIKEVMDSSFLSQTKKIEYCTALLPLGREDLLTVVAPNGKTELVTTRENSEDFISVEAHRALLQSRRRKISELQLVLTSVLGFFAALLSSAVATKGLLPGFEKKLDEVFGSFAKGLSATAIILVSVAIVMTLFERFYRLRDRNIVFDDQREKE
jgi:hypothetical protein